MRQIFFISSTMPQGVRAHGWNDGSGQIIGVVEMDGNCDAERVIEKLELHGVLWLPNHHGSETINPEHHKHLSRHGVLPSDTTLQAMAKVHAIAGFPPLKPKRF